MGGVVNISPYFIFEVQLTLIRFCGVFKDLRGHNRLKILLSVTGQRSVRVKDPTKPLTVNILRNLTRVKDGQLSFFYSFQQWRLINVIRPVQSTAYKFCHGFLFFIFCFSALTDIGFSVVHWFISMEHWPLMNKFVCKLHGYIVYL